MARLLSVGTNNGTRWPITPHAGLSMAFADGTTYAFVGWNTNTGSYMAMIGIENTAGTDTNFLVEWEQNNLNLFFQAGGTSDSFIGPTIPVNSDGWYLFAITRTLNATTVRWHKFIFATNTWQHTTFTSATSNGAIDSGSQGFDVGCWTAGTGSGSDPFGGPVAAAMVVPYAMSDNEVERLANGNWSQRDPLFLVEFPDGDQGQLIRRRDRYGRPLQITNAGTSIPTTQGRPPGFRFSTVGRRHG